MITFFFGLHGFWNKNKREKIKTMIKKSLPKDCLIEKIDWLTAKKERNYGKNVWEVYVRIAHKIKAYSLIGDYWDYRTNDFFRFDLNKNKNDIEWRF